MLSNAQQYFFSAPWLVSFPALLLFLTVWSFYLVGDGLRAALDPEPAAEPGRATQSPPARIEEANAGLAAPAS
jgi:hypothetical protein